MVAARAVAQRRTALPPALRGMSPFEVYEMATGFRAEVPDIIEFAVSDRYLNRPYLFPRQATLLKIIFLQTELFTGYDYAVIEDWATTYERSKDDSGEGNNGIVPDILERIEINRRCPCGHDRGDHLKINMATGQTVWDGRCYAKDDEVSCLCSEYRGRPWFRQVANISGRRGGKGHVGAYCGSYVLWNYMSWGDPQEQFGIDRDKRMTSLVFAGKKAQAVANQWGDLRNVIVGAPCFTRYLSNVLGENLTIYAPSDFLRMYERYERGISGTDDMATFEVVPKESTQMAGRGPASFMQHYDEMAHVVAAGANRSAEEVWESATPSLDQFKQWAFIYIPTSPWQKMGQAYVEYQQSLEKEADGTPKYPSKLMVQLTSWDIYKDWEQAPKIARAPGEAPFVPLKGAIQDYDDEMKKLEQANPETFNVERRSRWATAMDAYLTEAAVKSLWAEYQGKTLVPQHMGILAHTYRAHGDPSKSGAGFGFAIGHIDSYDDRGLPHVVFDVIHSWNPADYPDHTIDYDLIGEDLKGYVDRFMPAEMTFDQFNSVNTIQMLNKHIRQHPRPKRTTVYERPATAPLNWKTYETFKTALNMGLLHGPFHELADLELRFLQEKNGRVDHPTSGPVQTKDVADCIAIVTYELIGEQMSAFLGQALGGELMSAQAQGGMNPYPTMGEQAHDAMSGFSRARSHPGMNQMRRGRRR